MHEFLKKISIIVAFSFLSVLLGVYIMEQDLIFSSKRKLFETEKNNIKCLITGTSHTYLGLNPNLFPIKTINIAEVSKPVGIDIKIIKKYINNLNNLKYVIIPIDYFTFHYSGINEDFSKKYYYHWHIKNEVSKPDFLYDFHFFNCGCFSGLKEILQKNSYNYLMGFSPHYDYFSTVSAVDQINFSKEKINTWHQYFIDTLESNNIKNSILNLILLLNKKNIKTIIINMPVSKTLQKLYKAEILKSNALLLESLLNQSGAIHINLQANKVFDNDSLFTDCDHLNNNGATIATNEIKKIIINHCCPTKFGVK